MQGQDSMTDLKQLNADNWGRTSQQYAERAHRGSGMMMPLIRNYTQLRATTSVYIQAASQLVKTSSPKVIDIASGAGEPGISLAKHFTSGSILITDLAPGMVETAKKMCADADVRNVSFAVADAEELGAYPDCSFDLLTCNCGLMFMPHYDRALSEFRRVLKPGGVAIFSVWGPRDKTNMISVFYEIRDAIAPGDSYFADPGCLGSKNKLHAAVHKAGFSNIDIREVNVPIKFPKEATPMVLDNAVVSELLNRLKAAGKPDIYQEAQDAYLASVKKHGYLHSNEMTFPENIALFVTASK